LAEALEEMVENSTGALAIIVDMVAMVGIMVASTAEASTTEAS
jgi:hypothetical protein